MLAWQRKSFADIIAERESLERPKDDTGACGPARAATSASLNESIEARQPITAMPTARYRFVRAEGAPSGQRASLDARNALARWEGGGRSYAVEKDQDEALEARLTWSDADRNAGIDLLTLCERFGVCWIHLRSTEGVATR
jgi:hypothetical protein